MARGLASRSTFLVLEPMTVKTAGANIDLGLPWARMNAAPEAPP